MFRIAWVSLCHGAARSACFTRRVLSTAAARPELLRGSWEVTLFTDESGLEEAAQWELPNVPLFHYQRLFERDRLQPFDLVLYQLENDAACSFMQPLLSLWPGVLVLHDHTLNRLLHSRFTHSTGGSDFTEWMVSRFGAKAPPLGDYHVRRWPYEVFDRPFNTGAELFERSLGAVTFRHGGDELPDSLAQWLSVQPHPIEQKRAGDHGFPDPRPPVEAIKIAVLGPSYLWNGHADAFAAIAQLETDTPLALVLPELEDPSHNLPQPQFEQLQAARSDIHICRPSVQRSEELEAVIASCDIALALSYDSLSGLPAGTVEALYHGVPVIACSGGAAAALPHDAALLIERGASAPALLRAALEELIASPEARTLIGENGRCFAISELAPAAALSDLRHVVHDSLERSRQALHQARTQVASAADTLRTRITEEQTPRIAGLEDEQRRLMEQAQHDFGWADSAAEAYKETREQDR